MVSSFTSAPRSGFYYFAQGWKLVSQPGIRRFVILPLLVNILLMGGAFWWLFTQLDVWIPTLMSYVPDWLQWLSYLLWPLAVISVLLVFGYFFSTIANWIAAPFNGLLAEQLEARLTGATPPDTGIFGIMKDVPRIMKTRMAKICLVSAARNCIANSLLHPWYWGKPSRRYCGSCLAPGC
ncbi:putative sulfate transport protein [Escherichia coli]|uniref:Putative sulfate transport protein n=1 Tax=Escherichia coli TaxID=562 RepID=A0A377CZI3_ECOLX|nr:putative sulfate transport protein [Escherichia coli]